MSKELECLDRIDKRNYLTEREHKEFLGVVEKAIKEYEAIKNAEPSEALKCFDYIVRNLEAVIDDCAYMDCIEHLTTIKQALLKAQEDKKKLNEIEKLTHLLYSERRKIGQEYVKWCKENNTVFNDETNMITWVLAIKLKEWLK